MICYYSKLTHNLRKHYFFHIKHEREKSSTMSNIVNKTKDTLTGKETHPHSTTRATHPGTTAGTHTTSTTAGPHGSNMGNKLDPRVDSDLDGSRNMGARQPNNFGYTTAGPHSSNVANKVDPRVDSDLDGSHNLGARGGTQHTGTTNPFSTTHGTSTHGTSTNAGPHSSNLGNKVDPRIDSDLDNRGTTGTYGSNTAHSTTHPTTSGAFGSSHTAGSTNHGPHSSNVTNKADPRVDSDRDHRGSHITSAAGTGPAPNTAGPHKSDILNKLDPRVDSDLDGSKTMGGDKTHAGAGHV